MSSTSHISACRAAYDQHKAICPDCRLVACEVAINLLDELCQSIANHPDCENSTGMEVITHETV